MPLFSLAAAFMFLQFLSPREVASQLGVGGVAEFHWSWQLPAEFQGAEAFDVHNGRLFAVSRAEGALTVRWTDMADGTFGPTSEHAADGIYSRSQVVAFRIHAGSEMAFLLVETSDGMKLFRAPLDTDAGFGEFAPLPLPPLAEGESPAGLISFDDEIALWTERRRESTSGIAAWLAPAAFPAEAIEWRELPETDELPEGSAVVKLNGHLMVLGGSVDRGAGERAVPASPRLLTVEPEVGAWRGVMALPQGPSFASVHAASVAGSPIVTPRDAGRLLADGDAPTTMTVHICRELQTNSFSTWRELELNQPAEPVSAVLIDDMHGAFLIVAGDEGARHVSSYALPSWATQAPPTRVEMFKEIIERTPKIPALPVDDVIAAARDKKFYGIVVIAAGEEQSMDARAHMNSTKFRYMTMEMASSLLTDEEGAQALARFGLSGTPAYLLFDEKGTLIGSHQGGWLRNADLLAFTSPARRAKPQPEEAVEPAP